MGLCGSKEDAENMPQKTESPVSNKANTNTQSTSTLSLNKKQSKQNKGKTQTTKSTKSSAQDSKPEYKMLLLGSGESGKSTILKQIKIIHQNGFSKRELYDYKPFVFKNICECAEAIIKALRKFNLDDDLQTMTNDDLDKILEYEVPMDEDSKTMTFALGDKMKTLIKEPMAVKLLEEHRGEFYLMDSFKYFFDNIDRITADGYVPNVTDVIRTRKQTSGIYDTRFQLEDIRIHLFDVGGQRSERKKWIHCFDNVTAVMFCVALSEYDQVLLESPTQNRLVESLNLFESVVN